MIRTHIGKYHISTVFVGTTETYETMVFDTSEEKSLWTDLICKRTQVKDRAIMNHCDAIWEVMKWE